MRRIAFLLPLALATCVFADPVVLKGHTRDVNAVACSADGSLVVSGGDDGAMVLWDMAQRQRKSALPGDAVLSVAASSDGNRAAAGERYNKVRLTDAAGGPPKLLEGHTAGVIAVQFTADGKTLLSVAKDGNIRAWDAASGAGQGAPQRIPDALDAAAVTTDGKWAAGGAGGFVYLQNLGTKRLAWKAAQPANSKSVAIAPGGGLVAAGLGNSTVVLLDVAGKESGRIEGVDANGLAFSADGTKLAAAGHDNLVYLIDVAAKKVLQVWKGHERTVRGVCWLGGAVVSGSADMTVRLFE